MRLLRKFSRRPHLVQLNYKSGHSVFIRCKNFRVVRKQDGSISLVEWEIPSPDPLAINLPEIESIWAIK